MDEVCDSQECPIREIILPYRALAFSVLLTFFPLFGSVEKSKSFIEKRKKGKRKANYTECTVS